MSRSTISLHLKELSSLSSKLKNKLKYQTSFWSNIFWEQENTNISIQILSDLSTKLLQGLPSSDLSSDNKVQCQLRNLFPTSSMPSWPYSLKSKPAETSTVPATHYLAMKYRSWCWTKMAVNYLYGTTNWGRAIIYKRQKELFLKRPCSRRWSTS